MAAGGASDMGGATSIGGIGAGGGGALGGIAGSQSGAGGANAGRANAGGANAGGAAGMGGRAGAAGSQSGAGAGAGGMNTGGTSAGGTTGTAGNGYCPTTAGTPCNVMPVGDSITEGCCTAPMGGYRIEIFHQALTNQKNITFVGTLTNGPGTVDGQTFPQKHEGHGGWKISQIAGVIDSAISSSKPHIVLLKIGTNDINGNDDIANAPTRLANLIDQICKDAPNALLVVSAIIPTTNDGTNNNVRSYNTAIKAKAEAAAAGGKHVVFVDNYQAFAQNSNYKTALMADGLHPNTAGYVVLGDSFYGVISSYLPAK
jgi:lysophospholipase L1-like esterase